MKPFITIILITIGNIMYSQCDESTATIEETKQYISDNITKYGGTIVSSYSTVFEGDSILNIYEISSPDTANYWRVDFTKVSFSGISFAPKKRGKFMIMWKGNGLYQKSNLVFSKMEFNNELNILLNPKDINNKQLYEKLLKALKHLACLNGNKYHSGVDDKF